MSKHTPGPWKCNREGLITKDDRYGLHIAQVATVGMGYAIQPNAHLIAAAPAMYALLEQISKLRKDWRVADGLSSTEYMDELDTLDIDGLLAQAEGGGHE